MPPPPGVLQPAKLELRPFARLPRAVRAALEAEAAAVLRYLASE